MFLSSADPINFVAPHAEVTAPAAPGTSITAQVQQGLAHSSTVPDASSSSGFSATGLGLGAVAVAAIGRAALKKRSRRAAKVQQKVVPVNKADGDLEAGTLAADEVPPPPVAGAQLGDSASAIATSDSVVPQMGGLAEEEWRPEDGCSAACHVAYALSDVSFIFPITPSTSMAEGADEKMAKGETNVFNQVPVIQQMQSEAGAAGALHGATVAGALATTFTASQGLLLMIPNMYKLAGELQPCVFHVAARALAGQALSIFGDHSDVMAARQTGFAFLASNSVQESMDMAMVAHMATLKSSIPFCHFFDGFRTSHELNRIKVLSKSTMGKLLPQKELKAFRDRAVNPTHPTLRGTNQNTDIYFQSVEAANSYYSKTAKIVQECMDEFAAVTGRQYHNFEYEGPEHADYLIVAMGSLTSVVDETLEKLRTMPEYAGKNIGLLKVRLFRPWDSDMLLNAIPKGVKGVCVIDKCKEVSAQGEPLYMDVSTTIANFWNRDDPKPFVIGGRGGLGSKDFTPLLVKAVVDNLLSAKPKNRFTVGINDDVTFTSLPVEDIEFSTSKPGTVESLFWGFGSDGTVGANKNAVKLLAGKETDLNVQAYFAYDAFKSGGVTMTHLRVGKDKIEQPYEVQNADFISCSTPSYVQKYDVIMSIKRGGTFLLNTNWNMEQLEAELPDNVKYILADRKVKFYTIDAFDVAKKAGMGKLINNVMQTAYFHLTNAMEPEKSIQMFKDSMKKQYGNKGDEVVAKNINCIDNAIAALHQVEIPESWINCNPIFGADGPITNTNAKSHNEDRPEFVKNVMDPINRLKGNDLPVSAMRPDGVFDVGIANYQKRGVALSVPVVEMNDCIQCNLCTAICPHACIRPFLLDEKETANAPDSLKMQPAKGKEFKDHNFLIQVSPMDCTGCTVCVETCPASCLTMVDTKEAVTKNGYMDNWDYLTTVTNKRELVKDRHSLKGAMFYEPLLEFHGACEGCGETPYLKLVTQLFGERMTVANATGCTSIVGGTSAFSPYTTNKDGHGPAWANSLFEDNAEFGLGMGLAQQQRRETYHNLVDRVLNSGEIAANSELSYQLSEWSKVYTDSEKAQKYVFSLPKLLEEAEQSNPGSEAIKDLIGGQDMLCKTSQWIIGGDGWAYDIGFGGIDHILSSGANVNILIVDTEVYSNTGGQKSKATNLGAVAKFAATGKQQRKKDLAQIAMSYEDVYVASVSMNANYAQTVKAFTEAESYNGVSLLLCYAPCIEHRTKGGLQFMGRDMKLAAETGYWPLYRFDPRKRAEQKNPFMYDTKKKLAKEDVLSEFLRWQNRYKSLERDEPEKAKSYRDNLMWNIQSRHEKFLKRSKESFIPTAMSEDVRV